MSISGTIDQNLNLLQKAQILILALLLGLCPLSAQSKIDSLLGKLDPQKWAAAVSKNSSRLEDKIISKSERTLHKLQKQEEKIYKKMLKTKDSLVAKESLDRVRAQYAGLNEKLRTSPNSVSASNIKEYIPHLDSVQSALNFLGQSGLTGNISPALSKIQSLNARFQQTSDIRQFIQERKRELKSQLENIGLGKQLKQFNKEVYYYGQQIKEYTAILKDPKRIEKKALSLLAKTKIFQDFMRKNSFLASMFRMPGDANDPAYQASFIGLQTRAQVNNLIQQQLAVGGPNAMQQFQQNLQQAQSQLNQLKDKISKAGGNASDDDMPNFKPNTQRTKSFLQRLEYGTNFQSQKATNFLPVTSDIGLTVGYKLKNGVIGIGASYKLGWGRGWNNIHITNQGVGIRSYLDWKIKGSLWISGGYEQNYKSAFSDISQLRNNSAWQQSGLIGMSKTIPIKSKFFKKSKIQMMWDFLSYEQVPRTQPIVFRIGYNF